MAIRIRYAKAADLDAFLNLWWHLYRFHIDELNAGRTRFELAPDACEKLKEHYSKTIFPNYRIVVAEDAGKLVGYCEFAPFALMPIYKESRILKIRGLYVLPAYRRKGVGTRLLREVETVRRLARMKSIEIDAYANNDEALVFYSSLGFGKRLVQMARNWR